MKIKYIGHSAMIIESADRIILDPFITGNPKANTTPDSIKVDLVAVTHGHQDHLGDALKIAKNNNCPVVSIYEVSEFLSKKDAKTISLNFSGSVKFKNTEITMVPAWHSSGIDHSGLAHSGGTAAGFIIKMDRTIYFAGDTGVFGDMKLIGELYRPEIAMLPIGGTFTMSPKEAVMAAKMIKPKILIPIHYNTFDLIAQNPETMREELKKENIDLIVLKPGEEYQIS